MGAAMMADYANGGAERLQAQLAAREAEIARVRAHAQALEHRATEAQRRWNQLAAGTAGWMILPATYVPFMAYPLTIAARYPLLAAVVPIPAVAPLCAVCAVGTGCVLLKELYDL